MPKAYHDLNDAAAEQQATMIHFPLDETSYSMTTRNGIWTEAMEASSDVSYAFCAERDNSVWRALCKKYPLVADYAHYTLLGRYVWTRGWII